MRIQRGGGTSALAISLWNISGGNEASETINRYTIFYSYSFTS